MYGFYLSGHASPLVAEPSVKLDDFGLFLGREGAFLEVRPQVVCPSQPAALPTPHQPGLPPDGIPVTLTVRLHVFDQHRVLPCRPRPLLQRSPLSLPFTAAAAAARAVVAVPIRVRNGFLRPIKAWVRHHFRCSCQMQGDVSGAFFFFFSFLCMRIDNKEKQEKETTNRRSLCVSTERFWFWKDQGPKRKKEIK